MARQSRRIAHSYPTSPRTLEELSLPADYTHSSSGETLLLWDSCYTTELRRSFLFGTPTDTRTLLEAGHLIIDGTFKSAPQLFTQMVSIHGIFDGGWHIPLAYGLLPGRTNSLYTALFEALDRFGPYNPRPLPGTAHADPLFPHSRRNQNDATALHSAAEFQHSGGLAPRFQFNDVLQ